MISQRDQQLYDITKLTMTSMSQIKIIKYVLIIITLKPGLLLTLTVPNTQLLGCMFFDLKV